MQEEQKQTLAQSIPQNRQAHLSGKRFGGPANAQVTPPDTVSKPIDPVSTQQQSTSVQEQTQSDMTSPTNTLEKERVDNDFKDDFQTQIMRQELETKEDEIARLRLQSNHQQNQLEQLTTQFASHLETIQRLQSQISNIQQNQPQPETEIKESSVNQANKEMPTEPTSNPSHPSHTDGNSSTKQQQTQDKSGYVAPMNETHLRSLNKLQADVSNKLESKESQLKEVQSANAEHRENLQHLTTEQTTQAAVIKNMKQQVHNMKEEDAHIKQIEHLEKQIQAKEKQNFQLNKQIQELQLELKKEQELVLEVEQYRNQIGELKKQQLAMQAQIKKEKETISELSSELDEKNQATVTKDNQIKKLENLLDEALKQSDNPIQKEKMVVKANYAADTPKAPKLTDNPNSINGIVKTAKGKLLSDVVIIIKDITGHNLRALKSNELGQFVVTTSLPNGDYRVEVNKSGYTFDVVEMTLDGTVLPPVEIMGHEIAS